MNEYEDKKDDIQEENEDLKQVEETVEEPVEETVEETPAETNDTSSESVVEEHAKGDESKWIETYNRLDALEQRIGELMTQGGVEKAVLEDEVELSDIELENQKWYERNAQMRNM